MSFRLVDDAWDQELDDALALKAPQLRIVSPFIKSTAAARLLRHGKPVQLQVITRFNLADFEAGVSDISALRMLLEAGAQIRGVRHLHAKVYLLGEQRAIVTSANLTEAALTRNHEFGFVADESAVLRGGHEYFEALWGRCGPDVLASDLDKWLRELEDYRVSVVPASGSRAAIPLGDYGVDARSSISKVEELSSKDCKTILNVQVFGPISGYIKFIGTARDRAPRSLRIVDELRTSGSHWACAYPPGKRPRLYTNSTMFMGRLVKEPDDVMIYGRALALHHMPRQDDASSDDISLRPWKERWPHYIRVRNPEFVAGTLGNGISLNRMMAELGSNIFERTQENAQFRRGNTDPRTAYQRKPAIKLSKEGFAWLQDELARAWGEHGKLADGELAALDWPTVPGLAERIAWAQRLLLHE